MTLLASVRGFRGMDLDIARGEIVLLRGPNGSGKTSLLRALAGLAPAIAPVSVARDAPVGLSPQDARDALVGLTVAGEFRLRRRALPARLAPLAKRPSAELSSGEARAVALAVAEGAPLLLLDEPSEGLDADARARLRAIVARAANGGAVVLADHARAFDDLATRVVELAPTRFAPLPAVPRAEGEVIVRADACVLRERALPALALGPGFHVVRGANGSGKSTLLMRLAGLVAPRGALIAGAAPEPGRNVRLLLPHAADLLTRERVGDETPASPLVPVELRERHPLALSGGEAQRVALAKTFAADAPLYLLDEPEAHLDAEGRALLVDAIRRAVVRGACVLAATHDDALASLAQSEVRL